MSFSEEDFNGRLQIAGDTISQWPLTSPVKSHSNSLPANCGQWSYGNAVSEADIPAAGFQGR
jgi:hypothetical protein